MGEAAVQRLVVSACIIAVSLFSNGAGAAAKVSEATQYYDVRGKTGGELIRAIMRKGPRHGFLARAIAVTRFEPKPYGNLSYKGGVCRTTGAGFGLQITYVYPRPSEKLPSQVAARWRPFIAGVTKHEKTHARIGIQMASEIDRKIRGFAMKDKPDCRKSLAAMAKDVSVIAKKYTKKQTDFDAHEHKPNGNVERLVTALVGKE